MNTKILSVFILSFLLGACAAPGPSMNPALSGCEPQTIWLCRGNGAAPVVKIKTAGKKLKVSPSCVDVARRSTLVFRVLPPNSQGLNTVEIVPKDHTNPDHAWLAGKNSTNKNLIIIDVPDTVDERGKYDYGVIIGSRCIDPRVHVEN